MAMTILPGNSNVATCIRSPSARSRAKIKLFPKRSWGDNWIIGNRAKSRHTDDRGRDELVGTWRWVAYGSSPFTDLALMHLHQDGTALIEGEFDGQRYADEYSWEYIDETHWNLRRVIPLGEIPELDEETVEVIEYEISKSNGKPMELMQFDYEYPFVYEKIA